MTSATSEEPSSSVRARHALGAGGVSRDVPLTLPERRTGTIHADAARSPAGDLVAHRLGRAGTSSGLNLRPGSDDDGWVVPAPVTLSDGTRIQLYKDGEALHASFETIRKAKHLICLEFYIFADDPTGNAFADLLCRKSRDGVRVYVIYDSFGCRGLLGAEPDHFKRMRASGVRLRQFNPMRPWECQFSWRPINRDHRKLVLADDDQATMGGLNIGEEYGGSWIAPLMRTFKLAREIAAGVNQRRRRNQGKAYCEPRECDLWRDNGVGLRGPGVGALRVAFARSWQYCGRGGPVRRAELQQDLFTGSFGVLASAPTMNSPLRPMLMRLMRDARHSIELTMAYFAPDDRLVDGLCRAALRGVRVRLMLPGRSDVPTVRIAGRAFYETLMNCGVEVYERQGVMLHAKTIVIDERTTVLGSANLDYRSIEYNLELSAVIQSAAFGRQIHELFEHDVRYALRIDPAAWRARPWRDRLIQWTVSRARYLL